MKNKKRIKKLEQRIFELENSAITDLMIDDYIEEQKSISLSISVFDIPPFEALLNSVEKKPVSESAKKKIETQNNGRASKLESLFKKNRYGDCEDKFDTDLQYQNIKGIVERANRKNKQKSSYEWKRKTANLQKLQEFLYDCELYGLLLSDDQIVCLTQDFFHSLHIPHPNSCTKPQPSVQENQKGNEPS